MAELSTENISVSLVKNALNESTATVGGLCSSSAVNMWSLHKPLSMSNTQALGNPYWYRGANGLCGMNVPYVQVSDQEYDQFNVLNYLNTRVNIEVICALDWSYDKPTGGVNSPYRLGDFRGYYHNAIKFMKPIASEFELNSFQQGSTPFVFPFSLAEVTGGYANIQMEEMTGINFAASKLVAVIYNGNTHVKTIEAAGFMLNDNGGAYLASILSAYPNQTYDVFILFYNPTLLRFYPIIDSPMFSPMQLNKYAGLSIAFGNMQLSSNYNGVYKLRDEVMIETSATPFKMLTLGYFAVRFDVSNEGVDDLENLDMYSCIRLSGVSMFGTTFTNVPFKLYDEWGTYWPVGSTWNIPAAEYSPVIVVPTNQSIFLDGGDYSTPNIDDEAVISVNMKFTLSNVSNTILNGTFTAKYTGAAGWE